MNQNNSQDGFHILVAVRDTDDFLPLLAVGHSLGRTHGGRLTIITVNASGEHPDWLEIPPGHSDIPLETKILQSDSVENSILKYARQTGADLLLVGWAGYSRRERYLFGDKLDYMLFRAPCNVLVVNPASNLPQKLHPDDTALKILVPTSGGPNATLAVDLGLTMSENCRVTALYVTRRNKDQAKTAERREWLTEFIQSWSDRPHLERKIVHADNLLHGILAEAQEYDIVMIGASNQTIFNRLVFGAFPQQLATEYDGTTIIVKQVEGRFDSFLRYLWWKITHIIPQLTLEERVDVYKQVRRGARPKIDFFMMIGLAAGIAALGLLLNSPAVIIGAMLVAPLMAAIMGIGLSLIQADAKLLKLASSATLKGILLAIAVGMVMGLLAQYFLPVTEPTTEILSRTEPNLFDLGVALISGLAGAYALSRKDMSSSLPGVAIAAALVPPLVTIGIGLAWLNHGSQIAQGALVLFMTNLISIVAASGFVFFMLGFRPKLDREGTRNFFQRGVVSSTLLLIVMVWLLSTLSIGSFQQVALEKTIEKALEREVPTMGYQASLNRWSIIPAADGDDDDVLNLEVEVRAVDEPAYQDVVNLKNRVADELHQAGVLPPDRPFGLTLVVIPTTKLDPRILPTATRTATAGPTHTATATATATETAAPSPTATASPSPTATSTATTTPTATASATATPLPTATATMTPTPASAVVANTNGRGVSLRWQPGGIIATALPEGMVVRILYERTTLANVEWVKISDEQGRSGWVAAEYLSVLGP